MFLLSLSLDTWDEDEKDKRIRELEETLRKQKELMEILQKKLDDHPVDADNLKYHALNSQFVGGSPGLNPLWERVSKLCGVIVVASLDN